MTTYYHTQRLILRNARQAMADAVLKGDYQEWLKHYAILDVVSDALNVTNSRRVYP